MDGYKISRVKWLDEFDPTHTYGVLDPDCIPIEDFILSAKAFLPSGTPFKILECNKTKERAWYYSLDGKIPNPDRVSVLMECVA